MIDTNKILESISRWRAGFKEKRLSLLNKLLLSGKTKEEIYAYFDFDNMEVAELDFCPLYKRHTKCHNTKTLNCFGCDCRYYEVKVTEKSDKTYIGRCSLMSKKAKHTKHSKDKDVYILDCSSCTIPHSRKYAKGFIDEDVQNALNKSAKS